MWLLSFKLGGKKPELDPKPEIPKIQVWVRSGLSIIGIGVIRPETQNTPIFGFRSGFGNFWVFAQSDFLVRSCMNFDKRIDNFHFLLLLIVGQNSN